MEIPDGHFRNILLYYIRKGKNAVQARKKLYDVYGKKSSDIWVPHKFNEIQLTKRISICDSLLKRNETDPFLKRIIRDDEKWVIYDNVVRK